MVKFDEVINSAIEWSTTVLFRPFDFKKWLILSFVAFLAGQMAGFNLNLGRQYNAKPVRKDKTAAVSAQSSAPASPKASPQNFKAVLRDARQTITGHRFLPFFIFAAALMLVMIVFMQWLSARFTFVFLEDLIKNDASIKIPFSNHRQSGNSYFWFTLAFGVIMLALIFLAFLPSFLWLKNQGVFHAAFSGKIFLKILLACMPAAILSFLLIFVGLVISQLCRDFMTVMMYKDKIRAIAAFKKTLDLAKAHKKDIVFYILLKWGLGFCSSILYSIICFCAILNLIIPALIIALITGLGYKFTPVAGRVFFQAAAIAVFAPVVFGLAYGFMCLYLPFAAFLRVFNLKFFARLEPRYNLFLNQEA